MSSTRFRLSFPTLPRAAAFLLLLGAAVPGLAQTPAPAASVDDLWDDAPMTPLGSSGAALRSVQIDMAAAQGSRDMRTALRLPLPDGTRPVFAFRSADDHGDGFWTWTGETVRGERATISFGPGTVFGRIERDGGPSLQLETTAGRTWLRDVTRDGAVDGTLHPASPHDDARVPPRHLLTTTATAPMQPQGSPVMVDVVVGMTSGFVTAQGGLAAAQARVAQLVALANTGLQRGLVDHRLRVVHTLQVSYSDLTTNDTALEGLTGVSCNPGCAPAAVPAALLPLRTARDTYGGDLVVLLRRFRVPEQQGCGLAWLLGGGGFTIDNTDAPFGYSVTSIGNDVDEGNGLTYVCADSTLAHEVGHNLGQAHNPEDSADSGTHSYAYGYREASSTGFHTIMAYRIPNSSQFGIDYFGNPAVNYASTGRPTGTATANNGRSLQLSMPLVAQFRAEVPPTPQIFANGFEAP